MKELTIEEKARRYDIAVERADKFKKEYLNYKELFVHKSVIEAFDSIFSEPEGDEDERIRKDMIETIKKESKDFPSSVIAENWIAWIEKQGKQKPADKVEPKFKKD